MTCNKVKVFHILDTEKKNFLNLKNYIFRMYQTDHDILYDNRTNQKLIVTTRISSAGPNHGS